MKLDTGVALLCARCYIYPFIFISHEPSGGEFIHFPPVLYRPHQRVGGRGAVHRHRGHAYPRKHRVPAQHEPLDWGADVGKHRRKSGPVGAARPAQEALMRQRTPHQSDDRAFPGVGNDLLHASPQHRRPLLLERRVLLFQGRSTAAAAADVGAGATIAESTALLQRRRRRRRRRVVGLRHFPRLALPRFVRFVAAAVRVQNNEAFRGQPGVELARVGHRHHVLLPAHVTPQQPAIHHRVVRFEC
mmetsp:Transcript_34065/g.57189  ORF Transcript_34065/g.57189 Transcript_34065/m.57189 type:complete len:245 (-) Transcript_34065:424-1158(-)